MRFLALLSPTAGLWILLAIPQLGICGDLPSKDGRPNNYVDLMSQLVSPNKEPKTDEDSVKFPAGYNVKAQERVDAARQLLYDHFEEALPYLINALDDDRYCMTINWADRDAYYNYSVGKICRDIIESQLEVYRSTIGFSGPRHWHYYDYNVISKEWYQARKGWSLAKLQVEAINWAIERRKVDQDKDDREDRQAKRKVEIPNLKKLRDEIAKSGKPAKAQRMLSMITTDK